MTDEEPRCIAGYEKCLFVPGSNCCEHCGLVRSTLELVSSAEWKSYSAEEEYARSRVDTTVSNDVFGEDDVPLTRGPRKTPAQRREEAIEKALASADLRETEGVAKALQGCAVPFEKAAHAHLTCVCKECGLSAPLANRVWIFFHRFICAWCRSSAPLLQARIAAECCCEGKSGAGDGSSVCNDCDGDDDSYKMRRRRRRNGGSSGRSQADGCLLAAGRKVIVGFIKKNFPGADKYLYGCLYLVCKREQQVNRMGYLSLRAIVAKSGGVGIKDIYSTVKAINKVVPPSETVAPGTKASVVACPNYDGIIECFAGKLGLRFPVKRLSKNVGRLLKDLMGGPFSPETVGATAIYLVCSRLFPDEYPFKVVDYAAASGLAGGTLKRAFSQADSNPQIFSLPFKEAEASDLSNLC